MPWPRKTQRVRSKPRARSPINGADRQLIKRAEAEGRVTQCPPAWISESNTLFGTKAQGVTETEVAALLRVERSA